MQIRGALSWLILWTVAFSLSSRVLAQSELSACENENDCSFKKPNLLIVMDYSSSMTGAANAPAWFPAGQMMTTRWDAELEAARWILRYDRGFFANNTRIALSRFAHDPDLMQKGTHISTDRSFPPITDGFALDVPFDGTDGKYLQCKASGVEAAVELLHAAPPPPVGSSIGRDAVMLTWTRGALRSARSLVEQTRTRHMTEAHEDTRKYEVVLMTDGDWTCADMIGQNCDEDPAPEAAKLRAAGVPVHVIAFGDATMQSSLNEVALQGGTGKAIDAASPQGIVDALRHVLDNIRDSVIVPTCTQKLPRLLITMDASSSMLQGASVGETKWDKARYALSGNPRAPNPGDPGYVEPVLTRKVKVNGRDIAVEDLVHLGMVAFGGKDQQVQMFGFGPCMRDNIAWAMDPQTSCVAPGCSDAYGRAPLNWTFKDSDKDRDPHFVRHTQSFMPVCDTAASDGTCEGSSPSTFTGEGLLFARSRIAAYRQDSAPFPQSDQTRYVNILITDGETSEGSASVQEALTGLLAEGVKTYVIGFGTDSELDQTQLDQYAAWGSTERAVVVDPSKPESADMLANALTSIVSSLGLDACCVLNQCATQPEPADPHSVCGDGKVEGAEVCDDGSLNASYDHCNANCDGKHLFCGDGRKDGAEQCDDGNRVEHDGCSNTCISMPDELDAGTMDGDNPQSRVGNVPAGTTRTTTPPPPVSTMTLPATAQVGPVQLDAGVSGLQAPPAADDGCGCHAVRSRQPPRFGLALLCAALFLLRRSRVKKRRAHAA
ncbi:MAG TPA: VWA domain-containing protein [Polyangiales bacterium]|nr:VWA domain-containing protein [Polyangiales bacterium]